MRVFALVVLLLTALSLTACGSRSSAAEGDPATVDAQATFPPGPEGALIQYGHDIIADTPKYAGSYIRAGMSCQACHLDAGRKPQGGSFLGLYARYPQWNSRAKRFIMLQDRLAECFLYSMNGHPPAYESREMVAMSAYIAFLSRGAKVGVGFPNQRLITIKMDHAPDIAAGRQIYAAKCSMCHGANGAGQGAAIPPLWGPKSFNDGAGMNRLATMAAFVKVNMPQNAPGTLTPQQAYDVAAYVLQPAHKHPHFQKNAIVRFPSRPASFF